MTIRISNIQNSGNGSNSHARTSCTAGVRTRFDADARAGGSCWEMKGATLHRTRALRRRFFAGNIYTDDVRHGHNDSEFRLTSSSFQIDLRRPRTARVAAVFVERAVAILAVGHLENCAMSPVSAAAHLPTRCPNCKG